MLIQTIVILLYLSLFIELAFFHVPSVANTHIFFSSDQAKVVKYSKYQKIFLWSRGKKIMLLVIPHLINMMVFFIPIYYLFFEQINRWGMVFSFGIIMAIGGRLITFYSMYYVRKNNSQLKDDFTLHDTGPFSRMRNPGMTGMILFFAGLTLIWPSLLMVCALIYYFFYNHFRILVEEDFLRVMYKDKYQQYLNKVNRYF